VDNQLQILLNSNKNVKSVNVDTFNKIELNNNISEITEYDIRNVLSATEVFDAEREANEVYRIYGKIEYLSLLNGLKSDYKYLKDFFSPEVLNSRNILNSFEVYIVRPTTGYTSIENSSIEFVRYFEVVATSADFDIFKAAFSKNVYNEQIYAFNFNKDYDVSNIYDEFGMPLTELFIYFKYIPSANGFNDVENLKYTDWGTIGGDGTKIPLNTNPLNVGDKVYGDLIEYSKTQFTQTQLTPQTYYISTTYRDITHNNSVVGDLIWKYDPFISLPLRYFSNDLYSANTGDTSFDLVSSIPVYATKTDENGNFVWRDILAQGFIDPLTGIGVDYPFVNKKRYLFTTLILDVFPDLNDSFTANVFRNIKTSTDTINKTPSSGELSNIGKPCQ
jgi:hypothetical protein